MSKLGVWWLKGPTTTRAIFSKDKHAITTVQKSTGEDPPTPMMYIRTKIQRFSIIIYGKQAGHTGRPTDVSYGDLFLDDQLASLSFRDFGKDVVDGFIGLGDFCFLGIDLFDKSLVRFKGLRQCSLTRDLAILSEGNHKIRNRSRQRDVVGLVSR